MNADTIATIRAKHDKELADAIAAEEIRATLHSATGRDPSQVFMHPLYGRIASATFGDRYGPKNDYLTPAEVADIAEAFPPLPLVLRKDGCTGFPLASYAAANPKPRATDTEIAPWLVKLDTGCTPQHGHAPTLSVEWTATIAGRPVAITCYLAPYKVARVTFDTTDQRNRPATVNRTNVEFFDGWSPGTRWQSPALHHQTSGDNVQRLDRIQWGRGSDEAGHSFTYYTGAADASLPHYLRRIAAL